MRPIQHGDLSTAARALLTVPAPDRAGVMDLMLQQAEAADRYRKKLGKTHPRWGNGTLMAVALAQPIPNEPRLDDLNYLQCQRDVLTALIAHRTITK